MNVRVLSMLGRPASHQELSLDRRHLSPPPDSLQDEGASGGVDGGEALRP